MFWASLRPSSGAYNCIRSLWFYRWSVVVAALLVVGWHDPSSGCGWRALPADVEVSRECIE